jgi:hypothetical protein
MAGAAWMKEMREAEESEGAEESGKRRSYSTVRFPSALLRSSANLRFMKDFKRKKNPATRVL